MSVYILLLNFMFFKTDSSMVGFGTQMLKIDHYYANTKPNEELTYSITLRPLHGE